MTARDVAKFIDRAGLLTVEDLKVPVRVLDAKFSYGCTRLRVKPVGGSGEKWVDRGRVEVEGVKP